MRLLANPPFIRMGVVLAVAVAAFVAGVFIIRALRRQIVEEGALPDNLGQEGTLYPYTAVIQQLKQQKFELQNEQQTQRRRAKASESMAAAVIANLPCGVLFVAPHGLIKQCNAAARQILGFASPLGMSLDDLFRDTRGTQDSGESIRVADAFKAALQERTRADFDASYYTAAGEERSLKFALIPLNAGPGETLGLAAVIADETAAADLRKSKVMHSEISSEMALELRNSLSSIRELAVRVAAAGDPQVCAHLANDISAEAELLGKKVGGFLAGTKAASAGA